MFLEKYKKKKKKLERKLGSKERKKLYHGSEGYYFVAVVVGKGLGNDCNSVLWNASHTMYKLV